MQVIWEGRGQDGAGSDPGQQVCVQRMESLGSADPSMVGVLCMLSDSLTEVRIHW